MIKCPNCQYISEYSGKRCAICGGELLPTEKELDAARRELSAALLNRNKEKAETYHHLLADAGDVYSQGEYARILESRESGDAMDLAMEYYYLAAKKNDPRSAYRYALLAERASEIAGSFWLRYAAVLGYPEAFVPAARLLDKKGLFQEAFYYYTKAAEHDDIDAIVTVAKCYAEGGVVQANERAAKWYIDRLSMPPIYALKLAYKLRSVKSEQPPAFEFPSYQRYLKSLAAEAKENGFPTAAHHIRELLSDMGDIDSMMLLGDMLLLGDGCNEDPERALTLLERCVMHGHAPAALRLAEEYLSGGSLTKSTDAAKEYFLKAARLGYSRAYEMLADAYKSGAMGEINVPEAIRYYELAGATGVPEGSEKARALISARDSFLSSAMAIIESKMPVTATAASEAFRSLAIATAMGSIPAHKELARCYFSGFGTEQDRGRAFLWWEKAVELGDNEALLPLALCFRRGIGIRQSYRRACDLLKKAAAHGSARAKSELFAIYEQKMRKMVRSVYSQAMRLIHQKKFTEALALLLSSEDLGYPKALYTTGVMYEFGLGAKRDKNRAMSYYELAAKDTERYPGYRDPSAKYKSKILKIIR